MVKSLNMKHGIKFLLLLVLLSGIWKGSSAQDLPTPHWIGTATINDTILYAKLYIKKDTGRIHIPQRGIIHAGLKKIDLGPGISFEGGSVDFRGQANGDSLWGLVSVNGKKGVMKFSPYSPLDKTHASELTGMYRLRNDQLISLTSFSDGIELLNYATGEYIQCWQSAVKPGEFFQVFPLGPDFKRRAEEQSTVSIRGRRISVSKYNTRTKKKLLSNGGEVALFTSEPVSFYNGQIRISGNLRTPTTNTRRVPLIIIIPGSGEFLTDFLYHRIINYFASNGFAVFSYDKRGMGDSTGDLNTSDFYDFAQDIQVAIKGLSKDGRIDSTQIVLWAHSQGGWIAPIAANPCQNVSAIISVSAPTDTPGVQTTYWVKHFLKTMNYPEKDVDEAVDWMHLITNVMDAHGEGYEAIEAKLPEIKKKKWQDFVTVPESKENLLRWSGYYYNPLPELIKLKIPILSIFGGLDIHVNGKSNAEKLKGIFKESHNVNAKVMIFPDSDHDIVLCKVGNRDLEERYQSVYAPGYFKLLKNWTNEALRVKRLR